MWRDFGSLVRTELALRNMGHLSRKARVWDGGLCLSGKCCWSLHSSDFEELSLSSQGQNRYNEAELPHELSGTIALHWTAGNGGVTTGGLRDAWPPFLEIGRNRPFSAFSHFA